MFIALRQVKMPKALPVDWRISERELVLVRKYDNTLVSPRNEGFTCLRVFYGFSSKSIFATSYNKYYHSIFSKSHFLIRYSNKFGTSVYCHFNSRSGIFMKKKRKVS